MEKTSKQKLSIILFLSVITVMLFAGILVNQFMSSSMSVNTQASASPVFLPTLSSQRCYGTEQDDAYVDAFFVGDDTYVFYNAQSGIMQKEGNDEPLMVTLEGKLLAVALTPHGFATALLKEDNLSIKLIGFDGIPTASVSITEKNAELQYLGYDGNVCIAIKHQGEFDYVLSYVKYNSKLEEIYNRDIYSLYNLSAIACYPLSNKTVIFFNAQYGSVKRGGYSIIHNESLAMETEYINNVDNCVLLDAKPYGDGFILTASTNTAPYIITLNSDMQQTLTELPNDYKNAQIYTDGTIGYVGLYSTTSVDLMPLDSKNELIQHFADDIFDCIFIDGSAVFALAKNNVTYINHINTGIVSPIINDAPLSLKLKRNNKLTVFATLNTHSSILSSKGGIDVYCATLL